ncbi:HET-domain-containing protein [Annulohypoxylon bovei var. microspora]|nr:HET-domain-containing protein [Annulohypoxylon bovei var. microspora]
MICDICREGLEGIWDPLKTKRVCTIDEWEDPVEIEDSSRLDVPEHFIFGHHATQESFIEAMDQGCVLCNQITPYGNLEKDEKPNPKISRLGYYSLFQVDRKHQALMFLHVGNRTAGFGIQPHDFSDMRLNLDISPYTGDEDAWRTTQSWLSVCLQTHTSCNRRDTGYLPSRLVQLNNAAAEPTFCVVERNYVDSQSPYLTLSHCWGAESAKPRLKLTRSTLEWLSKEQPCRTLPKTFRDASEVAGRLGIRYLWIDSLCIFQDSVEDWRVESSSMQDVYGNAFLSIAALAAENNDGGLFFSRDPAKVKPTIFNFGINGPEDPQPYRCTSERESAWRLSFDGEPLIKRGWVVQERVLPPRVLYYGSGQMFWECYEATCCETHPKIVGFHTASGSEGKEEEEKATIEPGHAWKALMGGPHRSSCKDAISQLFMDWYYLQQSYTDCKLTVPSDKLVALSGIAKDMKRRLAALGCKDTKYLAGIWSHKLPQALVWNSFAIGRRPKLYRAPSWSWAAVDGRLRIDDQDPYSNIDLEILASVTNAWTTPVNGLDETGEVCDGMITLAGMLVTVNLDPPVKKSRYVMDEARTDVIDFRNHKDGALLFRTDEDSNITDKTIQIYVRFDTKEDVSHQVLCLPIKKESTPYKTPEDPDITKTWHVAGLAIVPVGDEKYRRVGLLRLSTHQEDSIRSIFENATRGQVSII